MAHHGSLDQFLSKYNGLRQLRHITEGEKYAAQTAWKLVEAEYGFFGTMTFRKFFEEYPVYKNFFMKMTNFEEPFENAKFIRHMLHVLLPTMGGMINNLDDTEAVYEALKRLGILHKKLQINLARENVEIDHILN